MLLATPEQTSRLLTGKGNDPLADAGGIVAVNAVFNQFNDDTNHVLKIGEAPLVGFRSNIGGYQLDWGIWDASASNPARLFTDLSDRSQQQTITQPILVVTTNPVDVAGFSGQKHFTTTSDSLLRATGFPNNTIGSVSGGFYLDLGAAKIYDGTLQVCLGAAACDSSTFGTNYWKIGFSGEIAANGFYAFPNSTDKTSLGLTSVIQTNGAGFLLGGEASGFVLAFTSVRGVGSNESAAIASAADAPDRFLTGAVLFSGSSVNFALTNSDIASLTRMGFAIFESATPDAAVFPTTDGFYFGAASEVDSNRPLVSDSIAVRGSAELHSHFRSIQRDGATVKILARDVGGFDLDWGVWESVASNHATRVLNPFDDSRSEARLGDILFASGTPTNIAEITGSKRFTVQEFLISGQPAGVSAQASGAFNLDLNNALLNDLRLQICLGGSSCANATQLWTTLVSPGIPVSDSSSYSFGNALNGKLSDAAGKSTGTFSGYLRGFFVGNSSQGFGFAAGIRWLEDGPKLFGTRELLDGALLFSQSASTALTGLTTAEINSLTRTGGAAYGAELVQGIASNFALGQLLLADSGSANSALVSPEQDYKFIRLGASTPEVLQSNVGGFDLHWGRWSGNAGSALQLESHRYGVDAPPGIRIANSLVAYSLVPTDISTQTGEKRFDSISNFLVTANGFANNTIGAVSGAFTVNFGTGSILDGRATICIGASSCGTSGFGETYWPVFFDGRSFSGPGESNLLIHASTPSGQSGTVKIDAKGHFVGASAQGFVLAFSSTRGVGSNFTEADSNAISNPDRFVSGAFLFTTAAPLSLPDITVETLDITWGPWNNPAAVAAVRVESADNSSSTLSTGDYLATLNQAPLAAMQGSASYASGPASAYIGNGNAGAVTDLQAGMNVDFDTGAITGGRLEIEVAQQQTWSIDFVGNVSAGVVALEPTAGQLSDFGVLTSNQINADLGGVFTGTQAEAFVGGFELLDQLNPINAVNGIYTIEK